MAIAIRENLLLRLSEAKHAKSALGDTTVLGGDLR